MVCLLKRYGSSHFEEVFSFVSATGYCTSSRGEFPFHHPWWHCNGKLSHSWQWLRRLQWCTRSIFLTQIESKCWDWEEHRHVHQTNSNPCFVILLELLGNAECTGKKCIKRSSNRSWTYRMYYMYRIHIACNCTCRNLSVHSCAFVALELDPLSNSASFASTETGLAPRFRSSLEHPFTRDIARQKTWYMVSYCDFLSKKKTLHSLHHGWFFCGCRQETWILCTIQRGCCWSFADCPAQVKSFRSSNSYFSLFSFKKAHRLPTSRVGQYLICKQ